MDGVSKKVVATFADREKRESAVVNLKDFSAYGNLEQIGDQWASQFVEILDKHPLETGAKVNYKAPGILLLNLSRVKFPDPWVGFDFLLL